MSKKSKQVEEAYKQLKEAVSLKVMSVPDRFGFYPHHYVRWDKKKAIAILEDLINAK
jgi:hypothetical protein